MSTSPDHSLWFVIDDDLDDQEIFTLAAKKASLAIQCAFANDGVHAIEQLSREAEFTPGCIFLDVNMPRMNGIECLEQLKLIARLQHVPIFMCSTSADPRIIEKAKALGARDFIVKPATLAEFAQVLARVYNTLQG